ncbi:acyl-CoA Delta-9 desaturase-like [Daktulosphaira vitifoliae]|uniref:acyl-CoA Delta-9 desaturase-like n=1 Tax=Daktulosphaira vitifoliae TaxID=58002 RepID=UPI0021AB0A56|nr:acyl-CoA Delta-9 desaturase-like [Daktulosphaira vitifoliae]
MDMPKIVQNIDSGNDLHIKKEEKQKIENSSDTVKVDIIWSFVLFFVISHLCALYGIFLVFTSAKILTTLLGILFWSMSGIGVTAGLHRLWSHKSYKAKWPLRVLLMLMSTMAFENHIYEWCMDHRIHHKYTDTNSDPHNAKRGFFFSHVGWLVVKRHPDYYEKCKIIDMSDLQKDPIVMFQKMFYIPILLLMCFYIPTAIPVYLWNETWINAFFVPTMLRYVFTLNMTWLVNSAAHIWGNRPYDASIKPSENLSVSIGALGEGWHNYHHTFPWDYKAAELGNYRTNMTTAFIDFFGLIGWAYDMKTVPSKMILKRACRTGDGSHTNGDGIWGWDDENITREDRNLTTVINKKND